MIEFLIIILIFAVLFGSESGRELLQAIFNLSIFTALAVLALIVLVAAAIGLSSLPDDYFVPTHAPTEEELALQWMVAWIIVLMVTAAGGCYLFLQVRGIFRLVQKQAWFRKIERTLKVRDEA